MASWNDLSALTRWRLEHPVWARIMGQLYSVQIAHQAVSYEDVDDVTCTGRFNGASPDANSRSWRLHRREDHHGFLALIYHLRSRAWWHIGNKQVVISPIPYAPLPYCSSVKSRSRSSRLFRGPFFTQDGTMCTSDEVMVNNRRKNAERCEQSFDVTTSIYVLTVTRRLAQVSRHLAVCLYSLVLCKSWLPLLCRLNELPVVLYNYTVVDLRELSL